MIDEYSGCNVGSRYILCPSVLITAEWAWWLCSGKSIQLKSTICNLQCSFIMSEKEKEVQLKSHSSLQWYLFLGRLKLPRYGSNNGAVSYSMLSSILLFPSVCSLHFEQNLQHILHSRPCQWKVSGAYSRATQRTQLSVALEWDPGSISDWNALLICIDLIWWNSF